jgi:hypothetical protein
MTFHRRIINKLFYGVWTACKHKNRKYHGWYGDWTCECGAEG